MKIGSILENQKFEKRVAIMPEIVKKYLSLGFEILLSKNYASHLGIEDQEYLKILNDNLNKLNQNKCDFVFYIAGVDIHHEDRLGKLKISDEGINKRDQMVLENFYAKKIPLCGVLGGGYNKDFNKLVELHAILHKSCASIL